MLKFRDKLDVSRLIFVIVIGFIISIDGKLINPEFPLEEPRDKTDANEQQNRRSVDRSAGPVLSNGNGGTLKSIPKPVSFELFDDIQLSLPDLIAQGFKRAENVLKLEKEALAREKKYGANKIGQRKIFHSRRTSVRDKAASACIGLGMLETSKLIAESFGVSKDDANEVLRAIAVPIPEIEAKTSVCLTRAARPFASNACNAKYPFRRYDGICNNVVRKYEGAAGSQFKRYLPPVYEDGVDAMVGENRTPPKALPNARELSNALSNVPVTPKSTTYTQVVKGFGQFVDHDFASTAETSALGGEHLPCCEDGVDDTETSDCRPIKIKATDPFYKTHGIKCLRFVRSLVADVGFSFSPREQVNSLTSFIDASNVYGSDFDEALSLRELVGGRMKENDLGEDGSCNSGCNFPFLPERVGDDSDFFIGGDQRVNEQPGLTTFHTIFVRFHNVLADELAYSFPGSSDEDIYQYARRFLGAVMQQIVYNEFLPIILSEDYAKAYGLTPFKLGYLSAKDYRDCFNPSIANVFATAAYRVGHTLIGTTIKGRIDVPLSDCFFNNKFLKENPDMFPSRIMEGELNQASMSMDVSLVDDIRNKLLSVNSGEPGLDLFALNIMRGRDHGLPSYNDWREFFGLPRFADFDELRSSGVMSNDVVNVFVDMYASVDDVEIFPAGIAETPVTGAVVGETFLRIIAQQFQDLKYGDRFWYEGLAQPLPFSRAQLKAIRKTTLASVLCVATDMTSIPANPFLLSSDWVNPPVSCATLTAGTITDGLTGLLSL